MDVVLIQLQGGMTPVANAKTDASGQFSFDNPDIGARPMLVRAITYRARGMETMVKKAISGGCEGVLHMETDPSYAAARS